MNIYQPVYVTFPHSSKVVRGVIVSKKWSLIPIQAPHYVVAEVRGSQGIAGILNDALYGCSENLMHCRGSQLLRVPNLTEKKQ